MGGQVSVLLPGKVGAVLPVLPPARVGGQHERTSISQFRKDLFTLYTRPSTDTQINVQTK